MSENESPETIAQRVRAENREFILVARRGVLPDPELLRLAEGLGDDSLLSECLLARAVALTSGSRPEEARRDLNRVIAMVAAGASLSPPWTWRLHETAGILADDFGEAAQTWIHQQNALEVARRFNMGPLIAISEATLGLQCLTLGMLREALGYLTGALRAPDIPDQIVSAIHLMTARVLMLQHNEQAVSYHLSQAKEFTGTTAFPKLLVTAGMLALELGELELAEMYAQRLSDFAASSSAPLAKLESVLFRAKLDQKCGHASRAIDAANWVIANADKTLAVRCEAAVVLGDVLASQSRWTEALDIVEQPMLGSVPAGVRDRLLTIGLRSNEALHRWEQAAWCHDELEVHAQNVSDDVLEVYELQFEAHQADALEEHNRLLQDKNDELELLSFEKDSTMEMIANDLQSPLTSLQLTLEMLEADPSTSNIQGRVGTALRSINRIETIAMHLSLTGEIDAGKIAAEETEFVLADLVASVVERSAAILEERDLQLQVLVEDARLSVLADEERFEQVLGAALWGVAEFSTPRSVLLLTAGLAQDGFVAVRLEAPDLNLSLDALTLMRTRSVSSLRSRSVGAGVDLAFYAADRLSTIIGLPLSVEASDDGSNSFSFKLPIA